MRADGLQVEGELEQIPGRRNVFKATSWKINVARVQIQTHGQSEAWGSSDLPPIKEGPFKSCVFRCQRCRVLVLPPSACKSSTFYRIFEHTIMQICQLRDSEAPACTERPGLGQQLWGRTESQGSQAPKARPPFLQGHSSSSQEDKGAARSQRNQLPVPSQQSNATAPR